MSGVTLDELLKEVGVTPSQLDVTCTREHLQDIALFLESWRTVAPYLGLSETEVEEVERDGTEEKVKRQKILGSWYAKFAFKAKYRVLIEALLKIGRADQAMKVCRVLVSQHPKEEAETVAAVQPLKHVTDSAAVVVIKCNVRKIKGEFANLVKIARKRLQKLGVDVEDVQIFLVAIYSSPDSSDGSDVIIAVLESATTLSEIFRTLSKCGLWDYHNYHLLQIIVEKFAGDDHELNTMIVEYQRDLTGHILIQKMEPYLDALPTSDEENSPNELVPPPTLFKDLTAKVHANITKHSLLYVDELWKFLAHQFSLPQPALILHRIARGCISITWRVPTNLVEYITRMTEESSNVFAGCTDLHILRVTLDGQCIYPAKTDSPLLEFEGTTPKRKKDPDDGDLGMPQAVHGEDPPQLENVSEEKYPERERDKDTALTIAASKGHSGVVKELLLAGATVDTTNMDGCTALYLAAQQGHEDVVELLLEAKADPELKNEKRGRHYFRADHEQMGKDTALMIAASKGHSGVVKKLLLAGATVDTTNMDGCTALYFAAQQGHEDVVELLLEAKADPELKMEKRGPHYFGTDHDEMGEDTALMIASSKGHSGVVKKLLQAGASVNTTNMDGCSALYLATQEGHEDVVELLLEAKADPELKKDQRTYRHRGAYPELMGENTALMIAASKGCSGVVKKLLLAGATVNTMSMDGYTALYLAAQQGHEDVVELLIEAKADPQLKMKDYRHLGADPELMGDNTALMIAASKGRSGVVKKLLLAGATVNTANMDGCTALYLAVEAGHEDVLELLLEAKADPELTKDRNTALTIAASKSHSMVGMLLQAGASVNTTNKDGRTALCIAVQAGRDDVVKLLLEAKADPNLLDKDGRTALSSAVQAGRDNVVKLLLEAKAEPNLLDKDGRTALCIAVQAGHDDVVKLLLEAKAEPNLLDKDGRTALDIAVQKILQRARTAMDIKVQKGLECVVKLLLKTKSDPYLQDKDSQETLLMLAAMDGNARIVSVLIQHGGKDWRAALCIAVQNRLDDLVKLLLKAKVHPDLQDEDGRTALCIAVQKGHEDITKLLLEAKADPNLLDKDGRTVLCIAAHQRRVNVVKLLLEAKANPNLKDKDGRTALIFAVQERLAQWSAAVYEVQNELEGVVKLLLETKADPNLQDKDGKTALYIAVQQRRVNVVKLLLEARADPNLQLSNGRTALHIAVQLAHEDVVKLLLEAKADPNLQHKETLMIFRTHDSQETLLMMAARYGNARIVSALIQHGARVNLTNMDGRTALCIAVQKGHVDVTNLLLEAKADPNLLDKDGRTALCIAAQEGHVDVTNLLLEAKADPNLLDKDGRTALNFAVQERLAYGRAAVQKGLEGVIRLLLEAKADPNLQDKDGRTFLHTAAQEGHEGVMKLLLAAKADLNLQDKTGRTALIVASSSGRSSAMRILLQAGANANITNTTGCTALFLAAEQGREDNVDLLLSAKADPDVKYKGSQETALMVAARNGNAGIVKKLIKHGANMNLTNKDGCTALYLAASLAGLGHEEVVALLLVAKADPDIQNEESQETALMVAARTGRAKIVKKLIQHGAHVNLTNTAGLTALDIATQQGHTEVCRELSSQHT